MSEAVPEAAVDAAYLPCPHMCMRGSDIGVYSAGDPVAYAHPECQVHAHQPKQLPQITPRVR